MTDFDIVVVGSGPNGLAAGVVAASHGLRVCVYESSQAIGGGCRTSRHVHPDFQHDMCSHAHPMALASPFFQAFDLPSHGVELVLPQIQFAQATSPGEAAVAYMSVDRTCHELGQDGTTWRRLVSPVIENYSDVIQMALGDMRSLAAKPLNLATFLFSVANASQRTMSFPYSFSEHGQGAALLSGVAAHAALEPHSVGAAAVGVLLAGLAHVTGWPVPLGGSQGIADAMARYILDRNGHFETEAYVCSLQELPSATAVILNTSPSSAASILGQAVPNAYRKALEKYRHGTGATKVDYALAGPVPWTRQSLSAAPTIHLGKNRLTISQAQAEARLGRYSEHPFILVGQPGAVDGSRAPRGMCSLSTYVHGPAGSHRDMTATVTKEIEQHAPGFSERIVSSRCTTAAEMGIYNPNYINGDILGGVASFSQLIGRPVLRWDPYRTPIGSVYLASASTAPGPGVHGMAGVHCMARVLRRQFGIDNDPLALLRQEKN